MSISSITSKLKPSSLLNNVLNTKVAGKLFNPKIAGAAATIALVSTQSKDALATYYYVTQSLKNEKIPEEKRKFVAGLDLANGILNQIFALTIGIGIGKFTPKFFDSKIAPKYFSADATKKMFEKINPKDLPFEKFAQKFREVKNLSKAGFAVIATLVGTQIICKRILVPLLATPMASYFKNKMDKGGEQKNQPSETNINTGKPKEITSHKEYLKSPED